MKNTEKRWDDGVKIYDRFASPFGFSYSTPNTRTLELFSVLYEQGEKELLLRHMMTEFLDNLSDDKIVLKNGKLYSISERLNKRS